MLHNKDYDHLVFLGRFSPYHLGHHSVIKQGLEMAKHMFVLVGSSNCRRKVRMPFTFQERKLLILSAFTPEEQKRLTVLPLNDYTYNDNEWVSSVQRIVNNELRNMYPNQTYEEITKINELKVSLIGHSKDHSSYYLKLFPTWGHIDIKGVYGPQHELINATDIRKAYFSPQWFSTPWERLLPPSVTQFLMDWIDSDDYQKIVKENIHITNYKKQWEVAPYKPIFSTVDSVVVQSGHVLLVRRGAMPGLGTLALPGGFLEQDETLLQGALRELREETGLKVPEAVLKGSLKRQHVYDDPHRSELGRVVTTAFLFHLPLQKDLPKVKGGDDASDAFFVPISELKAEDMFDDHWFIINHLTAGL